MQFVYGLGSGLLIGLFVGGFVAYKYAGILVGEAVAEYRKLQTVATNVKNVL